MRHDFYALVVGTLVVWRITHLFAAEDGPWDLLARLRRALGSGFFGRLADCFYCLSLWVAAPCALLLAETPKARVGLWLALSGGAILIERATIRASEAGPALYVEDKER
jgi:hypothetical protein